MSTFINYVCMIAVPFAIALFFWSSFTLRAYAKSQGVWPAHAWVFVGPALKDSSHPMRIPSIVFLISFMVCFICIMTLAPSS